MYRYTSSRKLKPISIPKGVGMSKKAKEALKHIEQGWIPVNERLLEGIKANLQNGHYQDDPQKLLKDIQKDPAIFFSLTKRLRFLLMDDSGQGFNPYEALFQLEEEKLNELFDFTPGQLTSHRSWEAGPSQELVQQITRVTADSAGTLSKKTPLGTELATASSLFRSLGYELITWNYPRLFSQVLSAAKKGESDLDQELQRVFDLTPQQIGARFAREWDLNAEIRRSLLRGPQRDMKTIIDSSEGEILNLTIQEVCSLSELFARAQEPEHFPGADGRWEQQREILEPIVGEETFEDLEEGAQQIIAQPEPAATDFGDLDETLSDRPVPKSSEEEAISANPVLRRCGKKVIREFGRVYRELEKAKQAIDAVRILANEAVPEAGFLRGCLYLQDNKTFDLKPVLRFGEVPLKEYVQFLYDSRNGVADSVHSTTPYSTRGSGITGQPVHRISGSLQNGKVRGVLYLEIAESKLSSPNYDLTAHFHVVRSTLNDCLNRLGSENRSGLTFL